MPQIVCIIQDRIEREYAFDRFPVVIGRLQRNDVYIRDSQISREHARIVEEGGNFYVEDLNSTNFVYVNRRKVLKEQIQHGDVINVGGAANLLFLLRPDEETKSHRLKEIADSSPEFTSEALQLKETMDSLAGELAAVGATADELSLVESGERIARRVDDFQALYEISYCVNSTLKVDQVLTLLVTKLLEVFEAERGCIMLRNAQTRQLSVALAKAADGSEPAASFRMEVAERAIEEGRATIDPAGADTEGQTVVMCAPLRVKGHSIGTLYVESGKRLRPFSRKDLLLFEALSHQAAVAIDNARLTEDLREKQRQLRKAYDDLVDRNTRLQIAKENLDQKVSELEALNAVSRGVNMVSDLDSVLRLILEKMVELLRAERGSIMLCNEETGEMDLKMVLGLTDGQAAQGGRKLRIGEGAAGLAMEQGAPVIVADGHRNDLFKELQEHNRSVRSLLCVPLIQNERRIGVINITNKRDSAAFADQDKPLAMTLANQAAITIENARLYNLAIFDGLTNLHVHRYFQIWLEKEFQRTGRYGKALSLVMLDIDNFKKVNDTYGHQFGDVILQEVASVVRKSVRTIDLAARYGGEEFAVILPETDQQGAEIFAERLRESIAAAKYCYQETVLPVTVSIGISANPDNRARNKDQLIGFADRALYHSKATGKNRVSVYSDDLEHEEAAYLASHADGE